MLQTKKKKEKQLNLLIMFIIKYLYPKLRLNYSSIIEKKSLLNCLEINPNFKLLKSLLKIIFKIII